MRGWKERGLEKHNQNESSSLLSWHHEWHWSYTEVPSWDLQSVEGAGKAASPLDDGHDKQNMAWPFNLQTLLKPKNYLYTHNNSEKGNGNEFDAKVLFARRTKALKYTTE